MNLDYLFDHPDQVLNLTVEHLELTATALAITLIVAIPLGILVATVKRLSLPILFVLGLI